ncbi:unnamed protein product [Bursaphelenchus okinawaensis]|uniref:Uncharacterized protein n=1 Tax=Bursaphelenchus okinawaensis TaxID=465554 RepID=A0A811JWB4_9BILA|nr:unnamed protein product [Bursaphelenchus okinawaensis]CAG9086672.1 unnamed protein product [Bursaphelenchus okinawaensis]
MTPKAVYVIFGVLLISSIVSAQRYHTLRNLREAVFGFAPSSSSSESTESDVTSFFVPKRELMRDPLTGQRYPASRAAIRRMFRFS